MANTDFENNICKNCVFFKDYPLNAIDRPGDLKSTWKIRDGVCRRRCTNLNKMNDESCGEHQKSK